MSKKSAQNSVHRWDFYKQKAPIIFVPPTFGAISQIMFLESFPLPEILHGLRFHPEYNAAVQYVDVPRFTMPLFAFTLCLHTLSSAIPSMAKCEQCHSAQLTAEHEWGLDSMPVVTSAACFFLRAHFNPRFHCRPSTT